ncbi:hypothetical protein N2152v2_005248 [Parachlorella kessleri]
MPLSGGVRRFSRGSTVLQAKAAKVKEDLVSARDSTAEQRAKVLEATLKNINSQFGKNSVMRMSDAPDLDVERSASGALTLDIALGGGWPKGRIVEIFGPESSGKTTVALHAMAEVQKAGGNVALIDAEHAFDPGFARKVGLDVDALAMCQPDNGEMALEITDQLIRSGAVDLIAVDSVAALVPRAELEGEIGQATIGLQARLMSQALRKLAGNASRHNCTVLFLNQLRQKVGVIYGNPEVTSGGESLKYYASVRVDLRVRERLQGPDGQVGIRVKATVKKNKVSAPYKQAEFDILFGSGISNLGCMLDAAEAIKVVERRGSWYYFGEVRLAQGREKALEAIKEDEALRSEIERKTRDRLAGKDINELYEGENLVVDEAFAEGEGVVREEAAAA